jgi:hypothetical protein
MALWCRSEYDENGNQTYYEDSMATRKEPSVAPAQARLSRLMVRNTN